MNFRFPDSTERTLTRLALGNPVAAAVGVLLVLLFGSVALTQIPVQMIPTVVIPRITITTSWRAAAPDEVEPEIIEVQEDVLRGVPGVEKMVSTASQGFGTVAIFLPILFLEDFSAQLFADLAFAISVAIIVSLIVAIGVVPVAAHSWLRNVNLHDPHRSRWERGTQFVMRATDTPRRRYGWIAGLVLTAASVTWLLLPPADYLPEGKQNWMFAFVLPPPGLSVEAP